MRLGLIPQLTLSPHEWTFNNRTYKQNVSMLQFMDISINIS